tara:strand:+ start:43 stop:486 length:444 start_codon:yes stop_codon:yes gene_type:complete
MSNKSKKIDSKSIEELTKILDELKLTKLSYSDDNISVTVAKESNFNTAQIPQNINQDKIEKAEPKDYKDDPRAIKSPMVGTIYLQPEPGANKFVDVNSSVKSGQTLLIIEAMKTMNPIESNLNGKVIKILVENEQAVEFGQPLMLIG